MYIYICINRYIERNGKHICNLFTYIYAYIYIYINYGTTETCVSQRFHPFDVCISKHWHLGCQLFRYIIICSIFLCLAYPQTYVLSREITTYNTVATDFVAMLSNYIYIERCTECLYHNGFLLIVSGALNSGHWIVIHNFMYIYIYTYTYIYIYKSIASGRALR